MRCRVRKGIIHTLFYGNFAVVVDHDGGATGLDDGTILVPLGLRLGADHHTVVRPAGWDGAGYILD